MKILFQGDSITDAGRARDNNESVGAGYPLLVKANLGLEHPGEYQFVNRGISGNRVVDLYARIRQDMINLKPDYMSILVGVNDVAHEYYHQNGVSAEKFEMVYNLLLEEIKQALPNIKLMILEPFVLQGSLSDGGPGCWEYMQKEVPLRAAAAKRVAEKQGAVFVPLQAVFDKANADAPVKNFWLKDGVHPTEAGHELIKREWLKAFEQMR